MRIRAFSSWTVFGVFSVACLGVVMLYRNRARDSPSLPSSPSTLAAEAAEKTDEDQNSPNLTDLQGDPIPRAAIARLGTVRLRPLSVNYSYVAFSPDGKTLVSDGFAGLCVWDAATGRRVDWFHDTFPALAACFSPDGKTLIAGNNAGNLRRWQVATGKLLQEIKQPPARSPLGRSGFFSADGTIYGVASGPDQQIIRLWDVATGQPILRWESKVQRVPSATLSPDGKMLAAGGERNLVHLIDTATGKEVRRIEGPNQFPDRRTGRSRDDFKVEVGSLAFSRDGRLLAGAVRDASCIWDVANGKLRYRIESGYGRVALSPDAKHLVCGNVKGLRLYEIASGKEVHCLDPSYCHYHPTSFSPDGKTLAALGGLTIRLWDVATGKPRHDFPGHRHGVSCLAFSPDGTSLASGDADKYGEEGAALVWDLATRKPRHVFPGHTYGVMSLAYSSDAKLLASGDGGQGYTPDLEAKIHIWDLQSGRLRRAFFAHLGSVQSLAFSPNGKVLASAGFDHRVKLWDVDSGARLRQIRSGKSPIQSVAFSRDGKLLILTDLRGERSAWDVDSGQKVCDLKVVDIKIRAQPRTIRPLLSPDGKILATENRGFRETSLQLWDVETSKALIQLHGHGGGAVTALAFSPDGRILASGGRDTTVLLWDISQARLPERQNTR